MTFGYDIQIKIYVETNVEVGQDYISSEFVASAQGIL